MCGAKARVASCRQRERGYVYVHHAEVAGHEGRHRVVFFVRMSNWLRPKHAAADLIECVRFAKDSPLEGEDSNFWFLVARPSNRHGGPDGRLDNGGGTVEEPMVRIRLPPAESPSLQ